MKLVIKLTKKAMEIVFETLFKDSDSFNSMFYYPISGKRTKREKGETLLGVYVNCGGYYDHLKGDQRFFFDESECAFKDKVSISECSAFGWETASGTWLEIDVKSMTMIITGSRRSIRDRFRNILCVGFGCEWKDWPRLSPAEGRSVGDVDWSKFDYSFKAGLQLLQYVTTEPEWKWFENAHEAIRTITGRWPSDLTDKTEAFLYASGLNSNQVRLVRMSA